MSTTPANPGNNLIDSNIQVLTCYQRLDQAWGFKDDDYCLVTAVKVLLCIVFGAILLPWYIIDRCCLRSASLPNRQVLITPPGGRTAPTTTATTSVSTAVATSAAALRRAPNGETVEQMLTRARQAVNQSSGYMRGIASLGINELDRRRQYAEGIRNSVISIRDQLRRMTGVLPQELREIDAIVRDALSYAGQLELIAADRRNAPSISTPTPPPQSSTTANTQASAATTAATTAAPRSTSTAATTRSGPASASATTLQTSVVSNSVAQTHIAQTAATVNNAATAATSTARTAANMTQQASAAATSAAASSAASTASRTTPPPQPSTTAASSAASAASAEPEQRIAGLSDTSNQILDDMITGRSQNNKPQTWPLLEGNGRQETSFKNLVRRFIAAGGNIQFVQFNGAGVRGLDDIAPQPVTDNSELFPICEQGLNRSQLFYDEALNTLANLGVDRVVVNLPHGAYGSIDVPLPSYDVYVARARALSTRLSNSESEDSIVAADAIQAMNEFVEYPRFGSNPLGATEGVNRVYRFGEQRHLVGNNEAEQRERLTITDVSGTIINEAAIVNLRDSTNWMTDNYFRRMIERGGVIGAHGKSAQVILNRLLELVGGDHNALRRVRVIAIDAGDPIADGGATRPARIREFRSGARQVIQRMYGSRIPAPATASTAVASAATTAQGAAAITQASAIAQPVPSRTATTTQASAPSAPLVILDVSPGTQCEQVFNSLPNRSYWEGIIGDLGRREIISEAVLLIEQKKLYVALRKSGVSRQDLSGQITSALPKDRTFVVEQGGGSSTTVYIHIADISS